LSRRSLITLLAASLLVNVGGAGYFAVRAARKGGLRYLLERFDFADAKPSELAFQTELKERYRKLPNTEGEVDFVGDSLMGDGPWADLFGPIKNRGIGGDTTAGLLDRLGEVTEGHPRKAFLLAGTNDLAADLPTAQVIRNARKILERFRSESPKTELYVLSILPVNQTFAGGPVQNNATIKEANRQLKELVGEFAGVTFVDVFDALCDSGGNLRKEWSKDGLHLNIDGYLALGDLLKPYLGDASPSTDAR
jgi:lysophospholipase L1-like esterase